MSFQCKWGCGSWLHIDPSLKSSNGKSIPLNEVNQPHCCHLNPYFKTLSRLNTRTKAKAVQIQEIRKIDDHVLIQQAYEQINHLNTRLENYTLKLSIIEKGVSH